LLFINRIRIYTLPEEKLAPSPKKAKKLLFTDPFIFHALNFWLNSTKAPFEEQIKRHVQDPQISASIVEACVATHFRRSFPTYFIKAEGEVDVDVDVAYVDKERFWPVEVKWRNQIRPKDLKQIKKYKRGRIFGKVNEITHINGVKTIPLPLALLEFSG